MKEKAWGIFVTENEVKTISARLEKAGLDIFEVRPLTMVEKLTYVKDPILFINEPHIIMFHATLLQYRWFLFKNHLTKVM